MKWNRWQCWIKTAWRSLEIGWPFNYPMDGCEWVEQETHANVTVQINKCECCGKVEILWS